MSLAAQPDPYKASTNKLVGLTKFLSASSSVCDVNVAIM